MSAETDPSVLTPIEPKDTELSNIEFNFNVPF